MSYIGSQEPKAIQFWRISSRLNLRSRRGRNPPFRYQIVRRQRVARRCFRGVGMPDAAERAGVVRCALVGDDLVQLARAGLGALADNGGGLAADFTGCRLALAKLTHVRHSISRCGSVCRGYELPLLD